MCTITFNGPSSRSNSELRAFEPGSPEGRLGLSDVPDPRKGTMDRRVRRTERMLKEAFVALVLERGYDQASIEDITNRADVARATFYAHYSSKEELMTSVFTDLVDEVMGRLTLSTGPWDTMRTRMVEQSYRHADELRDLYRLCLSGAGNGKARDAYFRALLRSVEANFTERSRGLGRAPRVSEKVMAHVFAGAHVALLQSWLEGELDYPVEEMALLEVQLLVLGIGWAHGLSHSEMKIDTTPAAPGEQISPAR
jgi:AcrR family transcriptional regulator